MFSRALAATALTLSLASVGCFSGSAPADGDDAGPPKDVGANDAATVDAGELDAGAIDGGAGDADTVPDTGADAGREAGSDAGDVPTDVTGDAADVPCSPELCPPPTGGHGARSLVAAGGVMSSARFRMVSTLGGVSATSTTMRSDRYRLHGGLVRTAGGAR